MSTRPGDFSLPLKLTWDVQTSHTKHVNFCRKKNTMLQKNAVLRLVCAKSFWEFEVYDWFLKSNTSTLFSSPMSRWKTKKRTSPSLAHGCCDQWGFGASFARRQSERHSIMKESVMILSFQKLWAQRDFVYHLRIAIARRLGTGSCQLSLALSRGCLVTHQLALCCCFFLKIAQKSQVGQTSP